jgi:hypothetical protein
MTWLRHGSGRHRAPYRHAMLAQPFNGCDIGY